MSNHPELTNRLKDFRVEAGFTQAALAEKVCVTRKTINTIENGVFAPSVVLALKIAGALKCRVEDLFTVKDEP